MKGRILIPRLSEGIYMKKMELLAPAGNMEKMKMALLYGADAAFVRMAEILTVRN